MSTRKDVVTIASIVRGNDFENKKGFTVKPVNINIVEKFERFKKSEDDDESKTATSIRQITVDLSEFTRILVLDGWLGLIKTNEVPEDINDYHKEFAMKYEDQLRVMAGAKLTIEREEIKDYEYDQTKPLSEENGEPKLDEHDEQVYDYKYDENGKPIKVVVGYGETKYLKIELTPQATELAKYLAMNKK